jgi:hypothetical protein
MRGTNSSALNGPRFAFLPSAFLTHRTSIVIGHSLKLALYGPFLPFVFHHFGTDYPRHVYEVLRQSSSTWRNSDSAHENPNCK